MPQFRVSEAAELLGVSDDTVRRWIDSGRLAADADYSGRHVVDGAALAAVAVEQARSFNHRAVGVQRVLVDPR